MAMATMRRWEIFAILRHEGRPHACRDRRHVSAGPEGRRASPAAITGSEFRSQSKISFIPGYLLSSADLVSVLLCVMQEWLQSASGNTQRQTRDSSGWLAGRPLATRGRCEREDGVSSNIPTATGWCSGAFVRASLGCRRGPIWSRSTAAARRAASCAAGASSPLPRGSSSRSPKRSGSCARCAVATGPWSSSRYTGADPLNLAGIVTPGETVPRGSGRVPYLDGVPIA